MKLRYELDIAYIRATYQTWPLLLCQVGRIVAALQQKGMLDNTVITFASDNGGPLDHANNYPRCGNRWLSK